MAESEKETGYIVPHTHWDREWRYPLWKTRMLLVEFMEELLATLDSDPEYRCFLMDGQTAPIEDYLEVVPSDRRRVTKHIRDDRIAIGPWYTLPDLYPVDGECLVRNLLVGTRMAEGFGGCMKIGYTSFGWGQTAQLPQIYAGFGFDFIVCAKRVSAERAPESEFLWEAPDGTRVLTSRLGRHARGNFYFTAFLPAKYGVDCLGPDFKYRPGLSGTAMHNADPAAADEDFFMIDSRRAYDPTRLAEAAAAARETTNETLLTSHRLYMNGTDFSTPHPELSKMVRDLNLVSEDTHFVGGSLADYARALGKNVDRGRLRVLRGELRDGPACDCSANALSARIYLKLLNRKAQNLLIRRAEPLAAILSRLGMKYPKHFFDVAWKYLLAAHPHDSINGVTQDKTADDVEHRLNQVIEIAQVLLDKAAAEMLLRIDLSAYGEEDALLAFFNPNPFPINGVFEACVALPADMNAWDFSATDAEGRPVPVQHRSREEKTYPVHDMAARPWPFATDRHIACFELGEIPGMGYTIVKIQPERRFQRDHYYWLPMRTSDGRFLSPADGCLENEFISARVNGDGSVDLLDKRSGESYPGIHYFEDTGDVGNYWAFYPPYYDRTFTTRGGRTRQWCEENGALSATLGVEYSMELPMSGNEPAFGVRGRSERSSETVELKIVSRFTLRKGARRLDVKTTMKNVARNHRLRVAFPTGIPSSAACASGHFTVDCRPVVPTRDPGGEYWPEMQTLPMQHFVDLHEAGRGLAILNKGLAEYEARDDAARTLYVTLFRAMGNMIVTWWEAVGVFPGKSGSQLLRDLEFEYSIFLHQGNWEEGRVYREADAYSAGISTYQVSARDGGHLPGSMGFLEIEPAELVLSALKRAEERENLIMRIFNPGLRSIRGQIKLKIPTRQLWEVDLGESRLRELPIGPEGHVSIEVPAGRILSLELE